MPILATVGRRHWRVRLLVTAMYTILALLGVTMVYPFLMTLTASVATPVEYTRFAPVLPAFWSREERFVRGLVTHFPGAGSDFHLLFPSAPATWTSWQAAGEDRTGLVAFARGYLDQTRDPARLEQRRTIARDYRAFADQYPIADSVCAYDEAVVAPFLRAHYTKLAGDERGALALISTAWGIPIESFDTLRPIREKHVPWSHPTYIPPHDARAADFERLRASYRDRTPWPACVTRPFPLKTGWLAFLRSTDARRRFGELLDDERRVPFPVPADAPAPWRAAWTEFVQNRYPLRLVEVAVTAANQTAFRQFIRDRFHGNLGTAGRVLGVPLSSWDDLSLTPRLTGDGPLASLWTEFVRQVPVSAKTLHSAEAAYQEFLLARYGSREAVNRAYGWQLARIEEAEMPFDAAYLVTFHDHDWRMFATSLWRNYGRVLDYLLWRGRAMLNTFVLITLSLLAALTVNPIAAYALSRFQMRRTPTIILFLLATTAFPAAVTMIPGYLLMRDLGLLNTYAALILPGIASGMGIFLLKGFFDSLPPELYEAATLDGAREWQMFWHVTLPLSKPILAVTALHVFMSAYASWEWALVVCQNPKMWTLSVWIYQYTLTWGDQPWAVMASFVVASLPVLVVFLSCQRIILRGIVLPQMK